MRLFIALQPSPEFRSALTDLQERLRAAGVTGRFLEPSNLHMTIAFIGEWSEDVTGILPPVQAPFPIVLSHVGQFPKAHVLCAGIEPSEALDGLADSVRRALDESGVPFDRQAFNPHITLVRKPSLPESLILREFIVPPTAMTVKEVCLYRSDRVGEGMVYTVIGRGPAAGAACF